MTTDPETWVSRWTQEQRVWTPYSTSLGQVKLQDPIDLGPKGDVRPKLTITTTTIDFTFQIKSMIFLY